MSNAGRPVIGVAGKPLGVEEVIDNNGTIERHAEFVSDNGKVTPVRMRVANLPTEAYRTQENDYSNTDPDLIVEPVQREIDALQAKLDDFTHYDRGGNPVYTLQGRERFIAEQNLGTLMHLTLPYQKKEAERIRSIKERAAVERQERNARILEKAEARAREINEAEEVEKLAKTLAAGGIR